jgi:putative nucleotidyltransferase with HDIG domain
MIKRIRIEQLVPGMFIHDLNCSWIEHPFVFNTLKVEDENMAKKIAEYGIRELFIDTAKGFDVAGAPTKEEADRELDARFSRHNEAARQQRAEPPPVPLKEEIAVAREVHHDARKVVHNMLLDARMGRQLEVEKLHPVVKRISDSIFRNRDALLSLSRLKHKDTYTFEHSVSVCVLLLAFCQAMGYEPEAMRDVGVGGLLHDIGKMMIPDHILNKPGALAPAEFTMMQAHAALGRDMLAQVPGMPEIAVAVAAQHHERHDGTGYPNKLKGDEITQLGQMASIVDVYDALTSDRIYHKALAPAAALKKLFEWSKSHFNEELVHHFIRTVGIYPVGSVVSLESGRLGVVIDPDNRDLLHPTVRVVYDLNAGTWLTPQVVALAPGEGKAPLDKVVRHESPQKWGIDPYAYL